MVVQSPEPPPQVAQGSERNIRADNIKRFEDVRDALPAGPSSEALGENINEQIASEKRAIIALKSVPAQIEGCRLAIDRGTGRLEKLRATLAETQKSIIHEEAELTKRKSEMAQLESEIALRPLGDPVSSTQMA